MEFLHETFILRHSTEHCCCPAHWLARDYAGSSRDSRRRGQLRRAVGKRSGVPMNHLDAWVVSIDDGRIVRWDAYWDPDEAKRALGLSE